MALHRTVCRSSDHGMHRLSCWFTTLLEVVSIVIDLADRDGTLMGRGSFAGRDSSHFHSGQRGLRSVYSSGMTGLTDRESSFSSSMNRFADVEEKHDDSAVPSATTAAAAVAAVAEAEAAGIGALIDAEESKDEDSSGTTIADAGAASVAAGAMASALQQRQAAPATRHDPQAAAQVAEAVRKVEGIASMVPIIREMIDAIEVSFWDSIY